MSWPKLIIVVLAIALIGTLTYNFFYDAGHSLGSNAAEQGEAE